MQQFKVRSQNDIVELYEAVSGERDHPAKYKYETDEDGNRTLHCNFQPQLPDLVLTLPSERRFLDYLDTHYGGQNGVMYR